MSIIFIILYIFRIISHARDLPLEQQQSADQQPQQERNADAVLGEFGANRITPKRAKLELRLDLSGAYKSCSDETTNRGTPSDTMEKVGYFSLIKKN